MHDFAYLCCDWSQKGLIAVPLVFCRRERERRDRGTATSPNADQRGGVFPSALEQVPREGQLQLRKEKNSFTVVRRETAWRSMACEAIKGFLHG